MKSLTKAEEEVMQILWSIEKGFVKDIIEHISGKKPAYNTVSTIVRILETKGFIGHESYGKSHEYYPLISKEAYRKQVFSKMKKTYFGGSIEKLVSFFVKEENISLSDLNDIIKSIEEE